MAHTLEYATPRAGDIKVIGEALSNMVPGMRTARELGVVNPRTTEVETTEAIVAKAEQALNFYRPGQIFLFLETDFLSA